MLPVEILVDVLFYEASHGHERSLALRVRLHLLNVRLLLHATLAIVFSLIGQAFLNFRLAEAHAL